MAIDFTRYDLKAEEPDDLRREWSLMNVMNQKATRAQDKPVQLGQLNSGDRRLIYRWYPELEAANKPQSSMPSQNSPAARRILNA